MIQNPNFAVKIEDISVWQKALENGRYEGSDVDKKDGFIHLSTFENAEETAKLHFANRENLCLALIDLMQLQNNLKWEVSRKGKLFPHIYGDISKDSMLAFVELKGEFSDCLNKLREFALD